MNDDIEKGSSSILSFVTIALVGIASLLRIIVGDSDIATRTVSILNIVMMAYVLFRVLTFVYNKICNDGNNDRVKKNQVKAFKRFRFIVWLVFLLIALLYVICQTRITNGICFCVANDIIAIITFGCSIEEETITRLLFDYFSKHTFM